MKIAVGGSAANVPHFGHKKLVEAVVSTKKFDQVRWIVSGDRSDKPGMPKSKYRYEMGKMLFATNNDVTVLYEPEEAIPTFQVITNLKTCCPEAEIIWYCGADHFVPRKKFNDRCDVLGFWDYGEELFENQKFLIIPRKGVDMSMLQLPKNYQILDVNIPEISSTEIRYKIANGRNVIETLPEIVKYSAKFQLYK